MEIPDFECYDLLKSDPYKPTYILKLGASSSNDRPIYLCVHMHIFI